MKDDIFKATKCRETNCHRFQHIFYSSFTITTQTTCFKNISTSYFGWFPNQIEPILKKSIVAVILIFIQISVYYIKLV